MLALQQGQLISSLWGALPQLTTIDPIHSEPQNLQMYQGCSNDMFESENNMSWTDVQVGNDSDDLMMEQNEINLQFIQAMVQLKSVANSCSYVPTSELQNILLTVNTGNDREVKEFQTDCSHGPDRSVIPNFPHSELDFGFVTNRGSSVSSGILKYIIHSSDANRLLVRSIESVLQYLGQSILTEKYESLDKIVQNWKGSVLEYSLNVVVELVNYFGCQGEEQNECREVCFGFIRNVVDKILNTDSLNMHPVWTRQCCIIVEMGNSKFLCIDFLNYLIDVIQIMTRNLKPKAASANVENKDLPVYKPGDIERSFYIFYMTEKLLKKWKSFQSSKMSTNMNDTSRAHSTNILDLWRQNWCRSSSNTKSPGRSNDVELNPASRWKDVLEELVVNFTEDYPFFTLYSFQCLELLQPEN
ncbi:uncharacterized protein LOC110832610 isoform X3 [Zootermopsis nevadensis]|nr:uncharacterized protein LOC110832610 isoform X3 [Zootermopsis nevadensis]